MGGHLSWFELGGTRWFSRPVSAGPNDFSPLTPVLTLRQAVNFLQKMAKEVDSGVLGGPNGTVSARVEAAESASGYKSPFVFEPVRRKLRLAARDGVQTNTILEQ